MAPTEQELQQEKQNIASQVTEAGHEAAEQARKEGLSEEEVNQRVHKARQEEKDKLYPRLEAMQEALDRMEAKFEEEKQEKLRIKKDAEKKAEEERRAKLSDEDRNRENLLRLEEQLREEREARKKYENEQREWQRQQQLGSYRDRVLQAAGNEIIPELVRGNSEEEIDRAAQFAKARYAELVEKAKEEARKQFQRGLSSASPDFEAFDEEELNNQIGNVDTKRYATDPEYRERILSTVAQAYPGGGGRR